MANNVRKLLQVSEESAPLVQIPIMVGNEMFVLTQQDVRRTEDIRYLSYNRIMPNGHLFPTAAAAPVEATENYFGGIFSPPNSTLQELFCPKKLEEADKLLSPSIHDKAPRNVANVSTQLAWSKQNEIEPLRYSAATSTSSLRQNCGCQHEPPRSRSQHTSCHAHAARNAWCQTRPETASAASNTDSKPAASAKSVANESDEESKNPCNGYSSGNVSDEESENKLNGCSASNVSVEAFKYPSRHSKGQQTCTYTDGQSYHRCSPREGRFPPQQQQQQHQSYGQRSEQDQSFACPQFQSGTVSADDPSVWPPVQPQDQSRSQPQDQLYALHQCQSSVNGAAPCTCLRTRTRCVHFSRQNPNGETEDSKQQ
ncbi:uncharacterized protein LOC117586753 [Drosophila guanche]|uniref:Uncharacterized protein n=1 Tax=Drosophila guanche TaxID=7266 RepID=A0A3B0JQQ9_DROGU|nr:uncharacterized protein LOC117586753 [Drosophila guanche]SPP84504.1 Hypothetical predicted protein [Drosophila guanche]